VEALLYLLLRVFRAGGGWEGAVEEPEPVYGQIRVVLYSTETESSQQAEAG
jgi:hypothetical protein